MKHLLVPAALLGAALASACSPPPESASSRGRLFRDFVAVEAGATSSRSLLRAQETVCADETYLALTLEPGEELTVLAELGADGTLLVTACAETEGPSRLRVTAEVPGREERIAADLEGREGWWSREVDLASFDGEKLRLRMRAADDNPAAVHISEWLVEDREELPSAVSEDLSQILLISVDTLREDALSAFGGSEATPALDRLVEESEVFSPHYAAAAWTKPSHASLLTGHHAQIHGAGVKPETTIRRGLPTMAQRFRAAGFVTAGLVFDCVWLDPKFGFSRGFDLYTVLQGRVGRLARQAGNWMARNRDRDFFYFLHTYEVHSDFDKLPYEAPGVSRQTVRERFGVDDYGCRGGGCAAEMLQLMKNGAVAPIEGEEEILRFLYGRSVVYLDHELGELFDRLRELGLWDGMTVVLTSDHGEQFFEHGGVEHGLYWDEILEVPLIVKWPQGRHAGQRRGSPSSAIDLMPTLLAAYGLPHDDLPGQVLGERSPREPVFAGDLWDVVRIGDLKAVFDYEREESLLFDLAADPEERRDLSKERAADLAKVTELLVRAKQRREAWLEEFSETREEELTDEERRRLEALGYLGG